MSTATDGETAMERAVLRGGRGLQRDDTFPISLRRIDGHRYGSSMGIITTAYRWASRVACCDADADADAEEETRPAASLKAQRRRAKKKIHDTITPFTKLKSDIGRV